MRPSAIRCLIGLFFLFCLGSVNSLSAQEAAKAAATGEKPKPRIRPNDVGAPIPTRFEMLRGAYGPYRANNDLLYYHLDIRVDPAQKFMGGKNTIRFRMLKNDRRIQLDLNDALNIDKILYGAVPLKYTRDKAAVFIDFPETLVNGEVYSIDFYYSGHPPETGRFGGITFKKDTSGHDWINTACEGIGASVWWPDKDQWRDEVENMDISVAIPSGLVDVSNGKFVGKADLGDGYTRWEWHVHYPINNYDVSLNIGNYVQFSDKLGDINLDFFALPEDREKAKTQVAQAKEMLEAYQHYFGHRLFARSAKWIPSSISTGSPSGVEAAGAPTFLT